jgi:hypothetical protein
MKICPVNLRLCDENCAADPRWNAEPSKADTFLMEITGDPSALQAFLTRHAEGFDLTRGRIDARKSGYNEFVPNYAAKCAALAESVGTDQFLWTVDAERPLRKFEMDKLVEWEVQLRRERILGYVDTALWDAVLWDKGEHLPNGFSVDRPATGRFSILLSFPLAQEEIFLRRVLVWGSADYALDATDEIWQPGAKTIGYRKHYVRPATIAEKRVSRQVRRDRYSPITKRNS